MHSLQVNDLQCINFFFKGSICVLPFETKIVGQLYVQPYQVTHTQSQSANSQKYVWLDHLGTEVIRGGHE